MCAVELSTNPTGPRLGADKVRTCVLLKVDGTWVGSGGCCCWHSAHHNLLLVTALSNLPGRGQESR